MTRDPLSQVQDLAIQIHGAERWRPGGFWRWRVIAVKELPEPAPRQP